MDCKKDISNIIDDLYLKQQLIYSTQDEMYESYEELTAYKRFLNAALNMVEKETAYFYLEEFLIEKVMNVVQKYRFDYFKEPGINDIVNKLIIKSNGIRANMYDIEYLTPILEHYVMYQEDVRDISFDDDIQLLTSMAQDYTVFTGLLNNMIEPVSDEYFLISTNYFINCCAEIYKIPAIKESTIKKLNEIDNRKSKAPIIMKEYAQSTKKTFEKIK